MRINLLPKEERGRSTQRTSGVRVAGIGAAALFALMTLLTGLHIAWTNDVRRQEADLYERVLQLRVEQSRLAAVRRENEAIAEDVARLSVLLHQDANERTGRLLRHIGLSVPPDAWLEHLSMHAGNDVYASGHAGETGDLSALLRRLQQADDVENLHLASMERVSGPDGHRREFSLSLTVKGWDD